MTYAIKLAHNQCSASRAQGVRQSNLTITITANNAAVIEDDVTDNNEIGRRTILSSSVQGSPRHMLKCFHVGVKMLIFMASGCYAVDNRGGQARFVFHCHSQ